jgi:2-polyprenyl-3-methyl-5-hydroxy-6-metoxy-1,4-benzoquinol methylase
MEDDIMNRKQPPTDWYKNIWGMDIKKQSWVENTSTQVDFIIKALHLSGKERILDLACGFGRHSLELARRGFQVVGVDITRCYIDDANLTAGKENLDARFICSDIRDISFDSEFDVVLNLADGAIGYLENDQENLKIFQTISRALKPGGKSLIDICNQEHARFHFPKRYWEIGENEISLPWFDYDEKTKCMLFGSFEIALGETAIAPKTLEPCSCTRLYDFIEVTS